MEIENVLPAQFVSSVEKCGYRSCISRIAMQTNCNLLEGSEDVLICRDIVICSCLDSLCF